jgi:iron complex transport system substrate-binding protein
MNQKRIVSFLPSATEILYLLGAGDQLVGVTHECDFPAEAKSKPHVIKPSFDQTRLHSSEIDHLISSMMQSGSDIYQLDEQELRKANPDLIIGQGLCDVCSPASKEIGNAVSILAKKPEVVILDPHNVDDILSNILQVARLVGKTEEADNLVSSIQNRIKYIKTSIPQSRPKVVCIEWLDPLFTAGHWVPQMVEIAGGINGINTTGDRSRRMGLEEIAKFEPDIIVLMPCGFGINRVLEEYPTLASNAKWKSMQAVLDNSVFAVDANSFFSKPGPRIVTGIEILAKIIHPEKFTNLKIPNDSFVRINS